MRWIFGLGVICLMACNPFSTKTLLEGKIENYDGKKLIFEIPAQDTTIIAVVSDSGTFRVILPLKEKGYVRMVNGKAVLPLFVKPGDHMDFSFNTSELADGEYTSVLFKKGNNPETRMMAHYYELQWFPSTEEMFLLIPVDFRNMMDSVTRYNDAVISNFEETGVCDPEFTELFRIQVKVPLAASYYYYPIYHTILNPRDSTEYPDDFNFFDNLLPKNDLKIYNNVYRYKTYEVSYWNHLLTEEVAGEADTEEQFVNRYIDKLIRLRLEDQIRDDLGSNLVFQYLETGTEEVIQILKKRYPEFISNERYRSQIEKWLSENTTTAKATN